MAQILIPLAIGLAYVFFSNASLRRPGLTHGTVTAIGVMVLVVSLVTFFSVEERYGETTGLFAMTFVCILVSVGSIHVQRVLERREVLRRIRVWKMKRPSTRTGVDEGIKRVSG